MSEPKAKKKIDPVWRQRILLYGGIFLALVVAAVFVNMYNNSQSVQLRLPTPEEEIIDRNITRVALSSAYPPWIECPSVNDPKWADLMMGDTEITIGEGGAAVCALSLVYPDFLAPDEINARLGGAGAYTTSGTVNWERASAALPKMRFALLEEFGEDAVLTALHDGQSVIARVQTNENTANWVVIYMAADAGYVIADPTTGESETLDRYGRVYSLVLVDRVEAE